MLQHRAHMLQRCVQLAVDGAQLAALRHLSAHVEPEAGLRLVDGDDPRAAARVQRHPVRLRMPATETNRRQRGDCSSNACALWALVCDAGLAGGRDAVCCHTAPELIRVVVGRSLYRNFHAVFVCRVCRCYRTIEQTNSITSKKKRANSPAAPLTLSQSISLSLSASGLFSCTHTHTDAGCQQLCSCGHRKIKETHAFVHKYTRNARANKFLDVCVRAVYGKIFVKIDNTLHTYCVCLWTDCDCACVFIYVLHFI